MRGSIAGNDHVLGDAGLTLESLAQRVGEGARRPE